MVRSRPRSHPLHDVRHIRAGSESDQIRPLPEDRRTLALGDRLWDDSVELRPASAQGDRNVANAIAEVGASGVTKAIVSQELTSGCEIAVRSSGRRTGTAQVSSL